MKNINKKSLIIFATLLTAAIMIGMPLSAASTPGGTPAYLAGGSSMNYVFSESGYTYYHNYTMSHGIGKTTVNNVTTGPSTSYYNVTVSSSNATIANITVPTGSGTTSYTNVPISDAKYMVPIYVSNTSKTLTFSIPVSNGIYYGNYNSTVNYSKAIQLPYYKTSYGTVKATEYIISEHSTGKATSSKAASYRNYTGTVYVNPATGVILGYNLNGNAMDVTSGTTAANETYTQTGGTYTMDLSSTNVVPVHTDFIGAYVGIAVAIVLLGATVYYFYGRKHETQKQPGENKDSNGKEKTGNENSKE